MPVNDLMAPLTGGNGPQKKESYVSQGQSPGFLNKCIGILEIHSESLSFFLSLQEKRGIEKKRETQNGSLECQYIYSKSLGSGYKQHLMYYIIKKPARQQINNFLQSCNSSSLWSYCKKKHNNIIFYILSWLPNIFLWYIRSIYLNIHLNQRRVQCRGKRANDPDEKSTHRGRMPRKGSA